MNTKEPGKLKAIGQYLSLPMAMSNPRKTIKRSKKPLGNLPVEILNHLSAYMDNVMTENRVKLPVFQSQVGGLSLALDVYTVTDNLRHLSRGNGGCHDWN